jgi:hypothetical protein
MPSGGFPGLTALIEHRFEEAIARGDFDNLPGAGRPLEFDDDLLVAEEMRVAHRVLRNSGSAPPDLQHLVEVNQLIAQIERDDVAPLESSPRAHRLRALLIQRELFGRAATASGAWMRYQDALEARLCRS